MLKTLEYKSRGNMGMREPSNAQQSLLHREAEVESRDNMVIHGNTLCVGRLRRPRGNPESCVGDRCTIQFSRDTLLGLFHTIGKNAKNARVQISCRHGAEGTRERTAGPVLHGASCPRPAARCPSMHSMACPPWLSLVWTTGDNGGTPPP